jgi:hypothetical protein
MRFVGSATSSITGSARKRAFRRRPITFCRILCVEAWWRNQRIGRMYGGHGSHSGRRGAPSLPRTKPSRQTIGGSRCALSGGSRDFASCTRTGRKTPRGTTPFWPYLAKQRWNGFMNEIAASVSREFTTRRLRLPLVSGSRRFILCCALSSVALLLAVTTRRDADQVPAHTPAPVARVLGASPGGRPQTSPSATTQVRNRFEPESWGDDRKPVAVVSGPTRPAFASPMWRFLLNGPVRPDIDLTHNQTYYGVMVTLPFGG